VVNGGALTSRDLDFYIPTGAGFTLAVSLTIEPEQTFCSSPVAMAIWPDAQRISI
jgi:hypothetical protein